MKLSEELQWRGFVNQMTFKDITELDGAPITFYWGVDPSAPSMTIGNLAASMMVRHFIDHGHKAVLLVGGATGMIGDPDGKAEERTLKPLEEVANNKAGIAAQYQKIFGDKQFEIVDNYDWFKGMGYLEFLRDVGKHVPLRQMLARDFVQARLGEDAAGISYAEFSYALIQGYDFLHLARDKGVTLQVCGSDQWGNSIAGVELIRRIDGKEAHVYSVPLVINKATGKKFGKSEDGAVWLDETLTSVYRFYQFWLNVDDEGVIDYMKVYTLLSKDEVERIDTEFQHNRAGRLAQKTLAYEVTKLVHGQKRADSVRRVSEALFGGGDYGELSADDFAELKNELPYAEGDPQPIADLMVTNGLAASKSEARRFLDGNAIYINGSQIPLSKTTVDPSDAINGYVVIRRGKNQQMLYHLGLGE
jgi:tyrosyl-tRNA synthetase